MQLNTMPPPPDQQTQQCISALLEARATILARKDVPREDLATLLHEAADLLLMGR